MKENRNSIEETQMEDGIAKLLHKVPYESRVPSKPCEHIDDGYDYGRRGKRIIRRCDLCGVYYEEDPD